MSSVQGIGSILGFECEKPLRRTLSALDMSSKKWSSNQQPGFSPLEKIASSDELQIAVEQKNDFSKQQKEQQQQPGQFDIWCSIQNQKPSCLPPPYVHPLVKKSKSSLTLKSLEICTENLGSESGSDGYPPSDTSLSDIEEQQDISLSHIEEQREEIQVEEAIEEVAVQEKKEVAVMNYSKKSSVPSAAPRSFPPPLKSLSKPGGGGIQMKTHRKDGRLVLEAVPVPASQNCFSAQRQDGRLVLTFASPIPESKSFENAEDVFETDEEVADLDCSNGNEIEQDQEEEPIIEEEEEEDKGIVLEMTSTRVPKLQPTGVINVHRSALIVNKFIGLTNNRNDTTWSLSSNYNKIDRMINRGHEVLPQSLPMISPPTLAAGEAPKWMPTVLPQQTVAAAAAVEASSFNRYEYCWRKETSSKVSSVGGIYHSLNQQSLPNTKITYHNNNNNLIRNKNNYFSNNLFVKDSITTTKGGNDYKEEKQNGEKQVVEHLIVPAYCKPEPRRSLVFWEPHCIATS